MRKHWIPPGALIFAQMANGISWLLVAYAGSTGAVGEINFVAIAWIHTVALGWATTAALGVLIHVIPAFTDAKWRFEWLARSAIAAWCIGVILFVVAILLMPAHAVYGALVAAVALAAYLIAAFSTLRRAFAYGRTEAAVARALTVTLGILGLTALLGLLLAWGLAEAGAPPWVFSLPATHAVLGLFGWLTLLIFGVSTRTVGAIAGVRSRFPRVHVLVGTLTFLGALVLAAGLAAAPVLILPGAALVGIASVAYAFDLLDALRRATVKHRPPQAFLAAAVCWLLAGLALGCSVLLGRPWQLAFGFLILAGWIGQAINAHIYHIGVRLLLTIYRGDDDETRPEAALSGGLSWLSFGAFQVAVASATGGLLFRGPALLASGGVFGAIAWFAMIANIMRAARVAPASLAR